MHESKKRVAGFAERNELSVLNIGSDDNWWTACRGGPRSPKADSPEQYVTAVCCCRQSRTIRLKLPFQTLWLFSVPSRWYSMVPAGLAWGKKKMVVNSKLQSYPKLGKELARMTNWKAGLLDSHLYRWRYLQRFTEPSPEARRKPFCPHVWTETKRRTDYHHQHICPRCWSKRDCKWEKKT